MNTSEKVAYLRGLAEGLGLDTKKKEDKLFAAIIDVLAAVAEDLDDTEDNIFEMSEELDLVSDNLDKLLETVENAIDAIDDEDCDDECCCCGGEHEHAHAHAAHEHHHGDDEECDCDECSTDDETVLFDVKCPACENEITVDEDIISLGSVSCPNCGELLEFDLGDDAEDGE